MNKLNNSSTILWQDTIETDLPEKAKQNTRGASRRRQEEVSQVLIDCMTMDI